jgi:hypothetical protein
MQHHLHRLNTFVRGSTRSRALGLGLDPAQGRAAEETMKTKAGRNKKLKLSQETLRELTSTELVGAAGGGSNITRQGSICQTISAGC